MTKQYYINPIASVRVAYWKLSRFKCGVGKLATKVLYKKSCKQKSLSMSKKKYVWKRDIWLPNKYLFYLKCARPNAWHLHKSLNRKISPRLYLYLTKCLRRSLPKLYETDKARRFVQVFERQDRLKMWYNRSSNKVKYYYSRYCWRRYPLRYPYHPANDPRPRVKHKYKQLHNKAWWKLSVENAKDDLEYITDIELEAKDPYLWRRKVNITESEKKQLSDANKTLKSKKYLNLKKAFQVSTKFSHKFANRLPQLFFQLRCWQKLIAICIKKPNPLFDYKTASIVWPLLEEFKPKYWSLKWHIIKTLNSKPPLKFHLKKYRRKAYTRLKPQKPFENIVYHERLRYMTFIFQTYGKKKSRRIQRSNKLKWLKKKPYALRIINFWALRMYSRLCLARLTRNSRFAKHAKPKFQKKLVKWIHRKLRWKQIRERKLLPSKYVKSRYLRRFVEAQIPKPPESEEKSDKPKSEVKSRRLRTRMKAREDASKPRKARFKMPVSLCFAKLKIRRAKGYYSRSRRRVVLKKPKVFWGFPFLKKRLARRALAAKICIAPIENKLDKQIRRLLFQRLRRDKQNFVKFSKNFVWTDPGLWKRNFLHLKKLNVLCMVLMWLLKNKQYRKRWFWQDVIAAKNSHLGILKCLHIKLRKRLNSLYSDFSFFEPYKYYSKFNFFHKCLKHSLCSIFEPISYTAKTRVIKNVKNNNEVYKKGALTPRYVLLLLEKRRQQRKAFRKSMRSWHSRITTLRRMQYWLRKYGVHYPKRKFMRVGRKKIVKRLKSGKIIYKYKKIKLASGKIIKKPVYEDKIISVANPLSGTLIKRFVKKKTRKGRVLYQWGPESYKLRLRPEYLVKNIIYRFNMRSELRRTQPWAEPLGYRRSFLNFRLFFGMVRQEKRGFWKKYTKLYWQYHGIVQKKQRKGVNRKEMFRLGQLVRKIILPFYGNVHRKFFKKIVKRYWGLKAAGALARITTYFEQRLDVLAYRLNFAPTIRIARWLIYHGFIKVNCSVIYNHAYAVAPYDVVRLANVQTWKRLIYRYMYQNNGRLFRKALPKNMLYSSHLKAGLFFANFHPRYFRDNDRVKSWVWKFLVAN